MRSRLIYIFAALLLSVMVTLFNSCKRKYDPVKATPIVLGSAVTIAQLRTMYTGISIKFASNTTLYGVVTMDETSGNIYKQVYIRDNSGSPVTSGYGAICIRLMNSGGLYVGDSIGINLNNSTLDKSSGGSLQIDSVDVIHQVVKLKTGLNPRPITATIAQLTNTEFDGHLVTLNGVEFLNTYGCNEVGLTYAIPQHPPDPPVNVNRHINDCLGNEIIAYNSGYANFAGQVIPNMNGSITGIANLYNTMQFTIRSFNDMVWNNSYCPIIIDTITQTFAASGLVDKKPIQLAGWTNIAYVGSLKWNGQLYGFSPYLHTSPSVSNYKSTDVKNEMWFISPPIKVNSTGGQKYLNFTTALQYASGYRQLSVLVSANFDGTNLASSQWTDLSCPTCTLFPNIGTNPVNGTPTFFWATNGHASSTTGHPLVGFAPPSGINNPNNNGYFNIAFRYRSSIPDSTGCTYLINNLTIMNNP